MEKAPDIPWEYRNACRSLFCVRTVWTNRHKKLNSSATKRTKQSEPDWSNNKSQNHKENNKEYNNSTSKHPYLCSLWNRETDYNILLCWCHEHKCVNLLFNSCLLLANVQLIPEGERADPRGVPSTQLHKRNEGLTSKLSMPNVYLNYSTALRQRQSK